MRLRLPGVVAAIAACAIVATASTPQLFVYRKDKKFNAVELSEGTVIEHHAAAASPVMSVGDLSVSLSAIDSCVVRTTDVPTLRFTFTDYPDVSGLWEKELYLNATLDVEGHGYVADQSGLSLTVKGRGNSTWYMPKKPMRLKFGKKTSLCGFAKAKSYVLLANYIDNSLTKNALAMWLAQRLGVAYANHIVPCNVYINGHYQGSYMLTEKVGINSGSVDIDETTGILFELSDDYDEPYKFRSQYYYLPVMVKDPDFDELYADDPEGLSPQTRLALWKADFTAAERLTFIGRGFEAFDLDAFVRYMLLHNLVNNSEMMHPKSVYIHKESREAGALYKFGPAWDFDVSCNVLMENNQPRPYSYDLAYVGLIAKLINTPGFLEEYTRQFNDFLSRDYEDMLAFLDEYTALIEPSAKLDGLRWPGTQAIGGWSYRTSSFDTNKHSTELRQWMIDRVQYLKSRVESGKF